MLVLFALTIVSGVKVFGETNQNNGKISNNHKKESKQRLIARNPKSRKHFDTSDHSDTSNDVLPSPNYEEAYTDDGYKNGEKRTRKGSRRRKGDDYQDRDWQTGGNTERKKMGKRKETGEDYTEMGKKKKKTGENYTDMGKKKKADKDFVLMGKRARKGKDYVDWLDKCSLKGKGKKTQVEIPGCGGWVNIDCNGGCINIVKVLRSYIYMYGIRVVHIIIP